MDNELLKLVGKLAIIAIFACLVFVILATIGVVKITDGCFLRYSFDENGGLSQSDSIQSTVTIRASGYLGGDELESTNYGKWLNTNIAAKTNQQIKFNVNGEVSLCKSYIPLNNIQSSSNLDRDGNRIAIPRLEDPVDPISLIFDAKTDQWRNIAQVFKKDKVVVSVSREAKPIRDAAGAITTDVERVAVYDNFNKIIITADCREDKQLYSPICGRYSIYGGTSITERVIVQNGQCYTIGTGTSTETPSTLCPKPSRCSSTTPCECTTAADCPVHRQGTYTATAALTAATQMCTYTYTVPDARTTVACSNSCNARSDCPATSTWDPTQYQDRVQSNSPGNYVKGCNLNNCCYVTYHEECDFNWIGIRIGCHDVADCHACWQNVTDSSPAQYKYDGTRTFPYPSSGDLTLHMNALFNTDIECTEGNGGYANIPSTPPPFGYINPSVSTRPYVPYSNFWYSADTANGLLTRMDTNESITNPASRGSTYAFARVDADDGFYQINSGPGVSSNDPKYKVILNTTSINEDGVHYLQYRFHDKDGEFADNTGGYVLNIKHTKCNRSNGEFFNDTFDNRGQIQYIIAPSDRDPNDSVTGVTVNNIIPNNINGEASITPASDGKLWMRILNNQSDYQESVGQYSIKFLTSIPHAGQFSISILNPLFDQLKGRVVEVATTVFKNMTCYNGAQGSCLNFFNYIKAILSLYIMMYGAMFLLGMTKISQTDLVIRVIKIGIVAGLMNGKTFTFFNDYVFNFVINFSDSIIGDMSGYSIFTSSGDRISNPFMFLDSLMSNIFFSQKFLAQLMALLALGISGVLYFILVFIALIIIIITLLRAIAIYIMAFMAIAVLIGLAPLFLTFMLFDFTRYLFDNWVKFTIRYMLEPVVLMAGIIILTQMFTIYLDFVLGYSVCWKCTMPFSIPFPNIPGLNFAFTKVPLFCIYWFAPWGFDSFSGPMGLNLQHIIALVIISYCIWGYSELSGKMVQRLTGAMGPSATDMGKSMSSAFENKAMEAVGLDAKTRDKMKDEVKGKAKEGLGNIGQAIRKSLGGGAGGEGSSSEMKLGIGSDAKK